MSLKTTADVVVIGGGVIGTVVAYFLAKCRMEVTLIERGGITCGTSGRGKGNVLVQDKLPVFGPIHRIIFRSFLKIGFRVFMWLPDMKAMESGFL